MAHLIPAKVEFAVIDDDLIFSCLQSERKAELEESRKRHDEYPVVDFNEPIVPSEATELNISFKSVTRIDNLATLDHLRVLRLDNNAIGKIENLSHLVSLEWLDLSFNNISRIEGLDTLTKLTDLTLFNNNISRLEGLDKLVNLQVLSIGNNKIASLENLLYLRQFNRLDVANFDGNPVCSESDYRTMVYAFMPWLKYLDYVLIDESKRVEARETHQHLLLDMEEEERNKQLQEVKEAEETKVNAMLERCGLKHIYHMVPRLFADDTDGAKLQKLPGVEHLTASFKEQLQQLVDEVVEQGRTTYQVLEDELKDAQRGLAAARKASDKKSTALVQAFQKSKKRLLRAAARADGQGDPAQGRAAVASLRTQKGELCEQLLELEMQLHEQCIELANEFEIKYISLAAQRKDMFGAFFREAEEQENSYKDAVTQKVVMLLEQAKEGDSKIIEDLDEDTALLLGDKDVVMGAVQASNDTHVGALLACEDDVRASEKERQTAHIQGEHDKETQRNHDRIREVMHLRNHFGEELDGIEHDLQPTHEVDDY